MSWYCQTSRRRLTANIVPARRPAFHDKELQFHRSGDPRVTAWWMTACHRFLQLGDEPLTGAYVAGCFGFRPDHPRWRVQFCQRWGMAPVVTLPGKIPASARSSWLQVLVDEPLGAHQVLKISVCVALVIGIRSPRILPTSNSISVCSSPWARWGKLRKACLPGRLASLISMSIPVAPALIFPVQLSTCSEGLGRSCLGSSRVTASWWMSRLPLLSSRAMSQSWQVLRIWPESGARH